MALKIGDKAPDFTVNDQDGNPVKLSDLKGKKTVIYFYPKDMTPGCTLEACNLRDNHDLFQKMGYQILGVSSDDGKSHRKFIEKEKLPFRLLADTEKTMHDAYGTWVEKSMYGRKYMGTARVTFVINEKGIIENIIDKVDTKDHTNQILGMTTSSSAPKKTATKKTTSKTTKPKKAAKKIATKKTAKKVKKARSK